jgi:hypothetical protein
MKYRTRVHRLQAAAGGFAPPSFRGQSRENRERAADPAKSPVKELTEKNYIWYNFV